MFKSATKRLLALSITVSLCGIANAQWPARYNGSGNGDDIAHCIARDARGNTFVAGQSYSGETQRINVVVHSYNPLGVARDNWPQSYNGSGSGDDIATSIHVNPDGSVIVGGTSYGGSASGMDYFAIKYDTNGNRVWPSSGSAGFLLTSR